MERSTAVASVTCSRAGVVSLAQGLEAAADHLGSRARFISYGGVESEGAWPNGGPDACVRLLAGQGASVVMLAQPDAVAAGTAPPYRVTLSLSASELRATVDRLLEDGAGALPEDCLDALRALANGAPLEDTDSELAARLLAGAVREMEATRERDRSRMEVQARLSLAWRHDAYLGLAQGLGHHNNNRLAVIMARAELLRRVYTDPVVVRCANDIAEACRGCTEFLERFMSYATRVPANDVGTVGVLDDVVRHALGVVQPVIEASSAAGPITVVTDLDCPSPVVVPRDDLQSGIVAIVTNAVEAMADGGTLTIRTGEEDGWATLDVEDTGVGMPQSVASKVFDPFYTTKGPEHAGLSLSHIHYAVLQHGGSIDVETEEDRGTVFHLRLPRAGHRTAALAASTRRAGSGPVLVVEDEDDVRRALCELLVALGFDVIEAAGGREAEEVAKREGPALGLVLTDLGVPDLSVFELTRRLRAAGVDVPVVLLTGWVRDVDPAAARAAGIDLVLAKPIAGDDLADALRGFGLT